MLTLVLIGLVAGAVTAISPCVLPVLPVIFFGAGSFPEAGPAVTGTISVSSRAGSSRTVRRGSPLKIVGGLVLSFAVLTLAGSVLVTALHLPGGVLRWTGLVVLFVIGLGLVVPSVQRILQRPFARFPQPVAIRAGGPFLLGLALGALYVPCAGPVIAAIAIAGAAGQVGEGVLVMTLAFSVGTAIPLLLFAYLGARLGGTASRMAAGARRFRATGGVLMIGVAIALAFDVSGGLQRWVPAYTGTIQTALQDNDNARSELQQLNPPEPTPTGSAPTGLAPAPELTGEVVTCESAADALANCGPAPALLGIDTWLNTPDGAPVSVAGLEGKVVLVDFWTFACINCQHVLPYVTSWYDTYHDAGLEIIGIHTPEFTFERDADNVRQAVESEGIHYPVGLDNSSQTWRNYRNSYWPAAYLVDATGTIRYVKFGEGDYEHTEDLIRQLLTSADPTAALPDRTPSR